MKTLFLFVMVVFSNAAFSEVDNSIECLAKNIYFEARNQPYVGQVAVAFVTLNRVWSDDFPNNICDVVYQRKQFSWYWDGKPDKIKEKQVYQDILKIAEFIATDYSYIVDPTMGALYYHATTIEGGWFKRNRRMLIQIGDHIFYD